jgi:hypothetical protein
MVDEKGPDVRPTSETNIDRHGRGIGQTKLDADAALAANIPSDGQELTERLQVDELTQVIDEFARLSIPRQTELGTSKFGTVQTLRMAERLLT